MKRYKWMAGLMILLFVSVQWASAQSFQQRLVSNSVLPNTEEVKKIASGTSLQKVLATVESEYNVHFLYDTQLLAGKEISKTLKFGSDNELYPLLDKLLAEFNLAYKKLTQQTLGIVEKDEESVEAAAQNQITGTVTDSETGEILPGVNILVKGTTTGTSTDGQGEFELVVESLQDTLVATYIGYRTNEVPINGRENIEIEMQSEAIISKEMVVVGYGTQKKENLVGSVSQADLGDISTRPSNDIGRVLQGTVPGLNVVKGSGGDPSVKSTFNIRGFNSINGGSPLILVDGLPQSIHYINPNDIESVTVLKDAEAAAIYGARGAFGVILIETKEGRPGTFEVSYSNNVGISTNTTRTDFITDPYRYATIADGAIGAYNGACYICYDDEDWDIIKGVANGEIEPYHKIQPDGTYKFYYNTDFYDYMFKKWRPHQMHNISISGGTKELNAHFAGRIYKRKKIQNIQDAEMNRYNLKLDVNFNPYDWLKFSATAKYHPRFDEKYAGTKNGWGDTYGVSRWRDQFPVYPPAIDGLGVSVGRSREGYVGRVGSLLEGNQWRRWRRSEFIHRLQAILNPIKGLEINFDFHHQLYRDSHTYHYQPFTYLASNRLEERTEGLDRNGEWRNWKKYKTYNIYATYAHDLFDDHHFKLMLGYNQEESHTDNTRAQVEGMLSKVKASNGLGTEMYKIDGSATDWGIQGFFGRFNYDYKEKYLFEINARYDGSSRFPEGERWGFFPSAAVGWQVDKEPFWTSSIKEVVSSLKLRASYGRLGNQSVGVNTFRQIIGMGLTTWQVDNAPLHYARVPSALPETIGWEEVSSKNIGVDIGFMEDKLTASFELYQRKTTDMYLPGEPLPAVFGASEPNRSYAALRNRGFELSVGYQDHFEVLGSQLVLNINANVSNSKAVITKFDNPQGLMNTFWEGQELGEIWGYHIDGQFQSDEEAATFQSKFNNISTDLAQVYSSIFNKTSNSDWNYLRAGDLKYVDLNGDGRLDNGDYTLEDHGDLKRIGNAMPKFPFGFNINANWRQFDVSVQAQGIAKQDWYPTGPLYWGTFHRPYASFLRKDLYDQVWDPDAEDNAGNIYPQRQRAYQALNAGRSLYNLNDYYLTNIGYLRIKNLTIGYTLPQEITQRVNIKRLRIFVSGENIFTWRFGGLTKYIDPEVAGSSISYSNPNSANARSPANTGKYPMSKTFSMGLQLKF